MTAPEHSRLGKVSGYADQYDASLLFPLPRAAKRLELGITGALPFFGADLWTAFELSWLNARGKPQVALAHFTVPCETPNIIESKSFKLYLNSFSQTSFADASAVQACLRADISEAAWRGAAQAPQVGVKLLLPDMFEREPVHEPDGLVERFPPGRVIGPLEHGIFQPPSQRPLAHIDGRRGAHDRRFVQ